ncbi:hypothetical protein LTR36_010370 [Oleoguttula mirabilis]|uniref:Isochorismatase-like domain-containing protein n=1 Tax=Oleoguttula mirabilis TaxID=1507867 RepID=A0AAV9J4R9_9PEZI|nr:hypothetical protein LTR36_010370 [Oleoguttula mirabilis]
MAAIMPDASDASSPLHYPAAQTALLLLDFQNFIIAMCGSDGSTAATQATRLRAWALEQGIMILHSIVDINGEASPTCKGWQRVATMLSTLRGQPDDAEEAADVLPLQAATQQPAALGAMALLAEHDIKSLIICGLSTSGAVLRTAVPATDEGFVVTVVREACADPRAELHEVLMAQVLPSRAHVVGVEEVIGWRLG